MSCKSFFWTSVSFLIIVASLNCIMGCKNSEPVIVSEYHNRDIHVVDTLYQVDTITERSSTIIREVDSATMAQFGVQLRGMQRAWLIDRSTMQREISKLRQSHGDTVHIHDSVPKPYPVFKTEYKEKPLKWWQQGLIYTGGASLLVLVIVVYVKIKKPGKK